MPVARASTSKPFTVSQMSQPQTSARCAALMLTGTEVLVRESRNRKRLCGSENNATEGKFTRKREEEDQQRAAHSPEICARNDH